MITALYRFFPLVVLLLMTTQISAQQYRTNFKGVLYDDTDHPVPGATLMVLAPADSTLIQFATSDVDGSFIIKGVPKGDYLLNISFLGLETVYKRISSGAVSETDL